MHDMGRLCKSMKRKEDIGLVPFRIKENSNDEHNEENFISR